MKENFYWFPHEGEKFLTDTIAMDAEAVGCLMIMRSALCKRPYIPDKMKELKMICRGASTTSIKSALGMLEKCQDGWYCPLVVSKKERAFSIAEKRSQAGKAGAMKRWS